MGMSRRMRPRGNAEQNEPECVGGAGVLGNFKRASGGRPPVDRLRGNLLSLPVGEDTDVLSLEVFWILLQVRNEIRPGDALGHMPIGHEVDVADMCSHSWRRPLDTPNDHAVSQAGPTAIDRLQLKRRHVDQDIGLGGRRGARQIAHPGDIGPELREAAFGCDIERLDGRTVSNARRPQSMPALEALHRDRDLTGIESHRRAGGGVRQVSTCCKPARECARARVAVSRAEARAGWDSRPTALRDDRTVTILCRLEALQGALVEQRLAIGTQLRACRLARGFRLWRRAGGTRMGAGARPTRARSATRDEQSDRRQRGHDGSAGTHDKLTPSTRHAHSRLDTGWRAAGAAIVPRARCPKHERKTQLSEIPRSP